MVSHHPAKLPSGHSASGTRDIKVLVVEDEDFTCLLTSNISIFSKAHGMPYSHARNVRLRKHLLHKHFPASARNFSGTDHMHFG